MRTYIGILLILLLATSCATKKEIIYFQDAEELNQEITENNFEPVIENNDILYISVSSLDEEVLAPFKRNTAAAGVFTNRNPGLDGYLVGPDGIIQFPVLGPVKVSGLTRRQVQSELRSKLSEFITDVVVDVRIMNFKVTVMGEVKAPGVYTIEDERVTIPQALALAGDLTRDGKRENIMIIRQDYGNQRVTRIDLTQTDVFESEFFYLKQNDIVYVEPSLKGVKKSGFIPDIPALLSFVTVVLSTVILLTNL